MTVTLYFGNFIITTLICGAYRSFVCTCATEIAPFAICQLQGFEMLSGGSHGLVLLGMLTCGLKRYFVSSLC